MFDTSVPSLARAYDYLLGGGANFAADRALGARLLGQYPGLRDALIASRTQAADSIAHSARHGVAQFLDVGAGLPTRPSTHESARSVLPGARVVYADRDPDVVRHGGMLVPPGVRYLVGDLAEPEALLAELGYRSVRFRPPAPVSGRAAARPAPAAGGLLDFSQPACLVLGLVIQALEPGAAQAVVGVLVRALAPGSYLVLTAGMGQAGRLPDSAWPQGLAEPDLESFFGGLDLLPPGIGRLGGVLCGTGVKKTVPCGIRPGLDAPGTAGVRPAGRGARGAAWTR